MTKQNSNLIGRPVAGASRGVTLVELLVVVTILSIIFAVLIPRLRAVNEDRNIREAARVVASAFSSASTRAINDGTAGLMIVPNRNFQQATFDNFENDGFDAPYFAGTRIFQMRRLPPYVGDDQNAMATIASGTTVTIDTPFEHDQTVGPGDDGILGTEDDTEPRLIVQVNDEIRLNNSSYRYRITRVNPPPPGPRTGTLTLTIALGSAPRLQSVGAMVPFVIHRQPRRLDSSLVELPDGYIIDLRYSGPVLPGTDAGSARAGTFFNQNQTVADGGEPSSIVLQFDITGGVSRMFFVDTNNLPTVGTEAIKSFQPIGPLNWLVTEYDPTAIGPDGNYITKRDDPLFRSNNKWVTVDHLTGGVNVASTAVPASVNEDLRAEINQSLDVAVRRQSASQ